MLVVKESQATGGQRGNGSGREHRACCRVLAAWRDDVRYLTGEDGDEDLMRNPPKVVFKTRFY